MEFVFAFGVAFGMILSIILALGGKMFSERSLGVMICAILASIILTAFIPPRDVFTFIFPLSCVGMYFAFFPEEMSPRLSRLALVGGIGVLSGYILSGTTTVLSLGSVIEPWFFIAVAIMLVFFGYTAFAIRTERKPFGWYLASAILFIIVLLVAVIPQVFRLYGGIGLHEGGILSGVVFGFLMVFPVQFFMSLDLYEVRRAPDTQWNKPLEIMRDDFYSSFVSDGAVFATGVVGLIVVIGASAFAIDLYVLSLGMVSFIQIFERSLLILYS